MVGGWAFDGGASYDFAYDQLNDARVRITTPQLLGIRFAAQARHYTPFFDYWTIWSAFSPVGFNEGRLSGTWTSRSLPLLVELGGAYREYEDTNAGPSSTTVRKDGYRGFGRVYWSPDKWYVDARYRAEEGFGGSRYGGDLVLGRYLTAGSASYVALRGTATETVYEFREGERYVTGGALEGSYDIATCQSHARRHARLLPDRRQEPAAGRYLDRRTRQRRTALALQQWRYPMRRLAYLSALVLTVGAGALFAASRGAFEFPHRSTRLLAEPAAKAATPASTPEMRR